MRCGLSSGVPTTLIGAPLARENEKPGLSALLVSGVNRSCAAVMPVKSSPAAGEKVKVLSPMVQVVPRILLRLPAAHESARTTTGAARQLSVHAAIKSRDILMSPPLAMV